MSESYILTINESKEWSNLVDNCEQPDIHFTPEYMQLYQKRLSLVNTTEAELFVTKNSEQKNYVLYPFFTRRINDKPIFSFIKEPVYDIVSPWYFGGVLVNSKKGINNLLKLLWKNFRIYAKNNSIISEFTRIHPLLSGNKKFAEISGAKYEYDVSYIDLTKSFENIFQEFKKSNRNAVNAAKRKGVKIKFSKSKHSLESFFELYTKTMKRVKAENVYFFSFEFLDELLEVLNENIIIASAEYEDRVIASSIFLFKYGIVHYWLSGFNEDFSNFFPNNLLLYEAIKWSKDHENKIFCLMGGSNKGLRMFKESFSKSKVEFFTLRKVYDQKKYEYLNEIRNKEQKIDRMDWFPLYRT